MNENYEQYFLIIHTFPLLTLYIFHTGQETIPSEFTDPFEGDEREATLAADPDLTDLDNDEWPTSTWLTPKGKLLVHFYK